MSRGPTLLAGGLVAAMAGAEPLSADLTCPRVDGRRTEILVCRGGPSMASHSTPLAGDADLPLRFRASPVPAGHEGALLAPGACAWAERFAGDGESRVLIVPFNGPLAREAYPIGGQARACAADFTCVMQLCASGTARELQAADGFIRLTFLAGGQGRATRLGRPAPIEPGVPGGRRASKRTTK